MSATEPDRIAEYVALQERLQELRRLATNLATALRTGEHQARAEALADWDAWMEGVSE